MIRMSVVKAATVVTAVVGAALIAAPPASADFTLVPPVSPYTVFYQGPTGELSAYAANGGVLPVAAALAPGTSVSTAPDAENFDVAWHGANGDLWNAGPNGWVDTGLAMAPGTSPSLLTFPDGNWIAMVVDTGGELQSTGSWGTSSPLGPSTAVAPGTSPSLAAVPVPDGPRGAGPDDFDYAWQGTNHDLWLYTGDLPFDSGNAMAPGTSPSMYSFPNVTGGYIAAFQASDGDLGWSNNANNNGKFGTNLAMAPGTSPSVVDPVSGDDTPTIAVQGSNGDLWTYGSETRGSGSGYDTGLPMMAGTNPSMMVTPYDEPAEPFKGLTYYIAYASNTGVVSLYGLNPSGGASTDIYQSTGQSLAPGTSPSIVSSLNWVDGEQVVFDGETGANWQTPAITSTVDTAPPALKPASKATIKPNTAPPASSDTCTAVRADLKQYAALGMKQVSCQTTSSSVAQKPAQAAVHATPDTVTANTDVTCGINVWVYDRTDECIVSSMSNWVTFETDTGAVTGTYSFLINQDLTLSTSSSLITENDSITYIDATGEATGLPVTLTYTAACGAPCTVATSPTYTATLPLNKSLSNISFTYQDTPGTQAPDFFNTSYTLATTLPGFIPVGGPETWSPPEGFRCDNEAPGWTSPGCVVPADVPVLVLPVSVYGDAAVNAAIGENYLAGTPGLSAATPLTRGNPANTTANRTATCAGFTPFPAGNVLVDNDSCDEYPFASTQQSGGALGLAASSCAEVYALQLSTSAWTPVFLTKYTGKQQCLRGHVNSTLNSLVGSQALNPMYINERMLIGDPFTVQVTG
jgi:hypothetical protein